MLLFTRFLTPICWFSSVERNASSTSLSLNSVFFLILALGAFCVSVAQMQNDWGVFYSSSQICAVKGSPVELSCTYTHPPMIDGLSVAVERTFWFTKLQDKEPLDLRADSAYAGRVQYHCDKKRCSLKITDLRESDSALYKFRFMTNATGGKYTGVPGVNLTVTGKKWNPLKQLLNMCLSVG